MDLAEQNGESVSKMKESSGKSISGDLSVLPMPRVLYEINKRALNGSLIIKDEESKIHCIYFEKGMPAKVRLGEKKFTLTEMLTSAKITSVNDIMKSQDMKQKQGGLQGQYLVEIGAVDKDVLQNALKEQISLKLKWLMKLSTGFFAFTLDTNYLNEYAGKDIFPVDPYLIINQSLNDDTNVKILYKWLSSLNGKSLILKKGNENIINRFVFDPEQIKFLSKLNQSVQYPQITEGQNLTIALSVLYCLYLVDLIEIHDSPVQIQSTKSSEVKDKSIFSNYNISDLEKQSSSDLLKDKDSLLLSDSDLISLIKEYEEGDCFFVLGLKQDCSDAEVQNNYMNLAKKFHPDRIGKDKGNLKIYYEKIFAQISESYQKLKTQKDRDHYINSIKSDKKEKNDEQIVETLLNADVNFRKAKIFLKNKKINEAKNEILQAIRLSPDNNEYLALNAWIDMNQRKITDKVDDLIPILKEAFDKYPKNDETAFYLAEAYRRDGNIPEAVKYYEKSVAINPYNDEAQRQLVLYKRRMTKSEDGGVLSKLFGKK